MPIRPIVKVVPAGNHRTMKVLVLKGDADRPAGIPLSHSGMKLMDQTTPGLFEEQKSVKIELNSENGKILAVSAITNTDPAFFHLMDEGINPDTRTNTIRRRLHSILWHMAESPEPVERALRYLQYGTRSEEE
jgi:hypothetical protein